MKEPSYFNNELLSETCGLSTLELEEMAARQARQLETQEQLLAAKAQRLRYLKSGGEAERLQRLREKVATQEERLRKLRALRGKVQTNRNGNGILSSDLESLRAVFNEKEKELSLAVAKVDELTQQLEDLRRGNKESTNGSLSNNATPNNQSAASMELEKLRRELMYRQKLREAQATRVAAQRAALSQRQEESNRVDRRIAELQERLHRKRFLNHQLAATLKHQENVEEFEGSGVPNKNDSKYQTLPYNAKLFTSFGVKQQNYQDIEEPPQDQTKYDKAIQQMQIITLDHPKHQQPIPSNNKLSNHFANNFQLHQILSQNHQNTKSAKSSMNNILGESVQQSPSTFQLLSNGIGHGHYHSTKGKSMSAIGPNDIESNGYPLVRPSNFLPTGASNPITNSEINGLLNSQTGTTKDVTSSAGSNASGSGSSCDGISSTNHNSDGRNLTSRPALPPKPAKPTPPIRQASTGDVFPHNQSLGRSLSTGDGTGMVPDRTELPIKPKPLFLKKMSSTSGNGTIGTSVLPVSIVSQDKDCVGNGKTNNSTVRVSINRRIEMPPAFLFPENDPPPLDLIPEHSSSTASSLSSGSSSLGGLDLRSSESGLRPTDTVDAAPLLHHHQKSGNPTLIGVEEYTLPDLFPNLPSILSSSKSNGTKLSSNAPPPSPNNNTNQYPSVFSHSLRGGQTTNGTSNGSHYSNNNYQTSGLNETNNHKLAGINNSSNSSPNDSTTFEQTTNYEPTNGLHETTDGLIPVMSLQLGHQSPTIIINEEEFSSKSTKQLESSELVIENGNPSGEETFGLVEDGTNNNGSSSETSSLETSNNGETNRNSHASIPGIIKRLKKGNLKSANKESGPNGRRVSFDPLALLLDASLEGELELVIKTAKEVGNPSAANDEGITALHNAICAGHSEVVRFLVEFGCDVNAPDSDGWSPLHCSASCNNVWMVKFLVERGACIFATTLSDHETAAEKCEEDQDGFGPCSEYLYNIQEKLGIANNGVVYTVFDYEAQNPDELTFHEGERLTVIRKGDEVEREWWWSSSENGTQGYVPRNLLGLYPRVMGQQKGKSET